MGVQYGLNALLAGQITAEQFVDLNSTVGGIDIDGIFTPERKAADPVALEILYSTGRMNSGSGAADIPEIDNRTGAQMDDTGFHPAFETFGYRARLDRSNGHHDNQIVWLSRPGGVVPSQFDYMRQWLDNLSADTSTDPQSVKVRRAKPADLADTCFMAAGVKGDLTCNGMWQHYAAPRVAAGGTALAGRDEVPAEVALALGLRRHRVHRRAMGAAASHLRDRCVRLLEAGRLPAEAEGEMAELRGGPGGQPLGDPPLSQGPTELLGELSALLDSFELRKQEGRKLEVVLEQVGRKLAKADLDRACEGLDDFVSKARKESGRSLTPAQSEALVAEAARIQVLLGC